MNTDHIERGMKYGKDFITVNGEVILPPTTRREAGDALSRRALQLFKQGTSHDRLVES